MLLLYIWIARAYARVHCTIFFVYYFYILSYIPFSFRAVFFALVNKTRRKQSVNPIHELRSIYAIGWPSIFFSSLHFSHCTMRAHSFSSFARAFLFGSTKPFRRCIRCFFFPLLFKYLILDGDLDFTFDQIIQENEQSERAKTQLRRKQRWRQTIPPTIETYTHHVHMYIARPYLWKHLQLFAHSLIIIFFFRLFYSVRLSM